MAADPDNVKNLAADPPHRATLDRLRAALKSHTLEIVDNGFLPEGSPLEGYDASRMPGTWPLERVFDLANLASERNPANLSKLIAALDDPSEPVRWWAAQGCTMLRDKAAPAEAALRKCLEDASGAVQIAAAEALARLGKTAIALPVLERWLDNTDHPFFALQAANVLDRLGEAARPALPAMRQVSATGYLQRIMGHAIAALEARKPD
jgi:hypothetical protein